MDVNLPVSKKFTKGNLQKPVTPAQEFLESNWTAQHGLQRLKPSFRATCRGSEQQISLTDPSVEILKLVEIPELMESHVENELYCCMFD
ncbi:hypothetical protein AOLI_G00059520 [Acnodon oligacanthus]